MQRRELLQAGLAGAALASPLGAPAQAAWPEGKPITMIVPFPPGGVADTVGRPVAEALARELKATVVVENRAGAGGGLGMAAAARAPADGYTLHQYDSTAFAYVPNMRKVGYDPLRSFVPVAFLGDAPFVLIAHPSVPARTLPELVAHARAHPGRLNVASAGVGSPHHLIGELLKQRAGITLNHVPYKGAAQYIADIVGGQVDLAVSTIGPAAQHIQSGRVRALGVTTGQRASSLPDVPTIAEQGFEGFDEKPWNCFVVPAATPADVVERLRTAFRAVYEDPEVVAGLRKAGLERVGSVPAERLTELMRADLAKWGEVIRRANITLEN
jgi:tripartite-type tricarboxylate transporter receptor subunit TctC